VALLALAAVPTGLVAQERGEITGVVTERSTQRPLSGVQVLIAGSAIGNRTGADGRYRIPGVPAGTQRVTASLIGYDAPAQTVTVAAGQTATANFVMAPAAVGLDELVVTASGETQRRREMGNSVSTVNTERVEMAAVRDLGQLVSRAAGVVVTPSSGAVGSGNRIRIRGNTSVSLANDPLLIVDGVRIDNSPNSAGLFTGGQSTSRFEDINPEDIETVEILKGPAAAALYGTAAANGVIQVTTKRGRAGRSTIRVYAERGTSEQTADFPLNYLQRGRTAAGARTNCDFLARSAGTCVAADSLYSNSVLASEFGPFRTGSSNQYGVSLSGGSDVATYYVSADREEAIGTQINNDLDRTNVRANMTGSIGRFRLSANTGYVESETQLPQADNSASSPILNGLLGSPDPANIARGQGYRAPFTQINTFSWENLERLRRYTGSVNGEFRPWSWLNVTGVAGVDNTSRFEGSFIAGNIGHPSFPAGIREQYRTNQRNLTGNIGATAAHTFAERISSQTSAGMQYSRETFDWTYALAEVIAPGTRTGSVPSSAQETFADNKTFGAYLQQQFGLNDRLFVTASARGDQNSAFGQDIDFVVYPSVSASWVVLEEPWFPEVGALSNLRLRAAYGESGLRPGRLNAVQTFGTLSAAVGANVVPGFVVTNIGNPELKPEVAREVEFGADLGLLDGRLALEFTHYNKKSQDALVSRPLPPSVGGPANQFFNLGSVQNKGWELGLNVEPVRMERFGMDFNVNYTTNRNELLSLGDTLIPPIIFGIGGNAQRHTVGYPLGGFWGQRYAYEDKNGDQLLQSSEVARLPAAQQTDTVRNTSYLGTPFPTREISVGGNVSFLRMFRLSGLLNHKGGHKQVNYTRLLRETNTTLGFAEVRQVPGAASLEQQAAILAARAPISTIAGYVEDADFWKLRELALTVSTPGSITRRFGLAEDGLSLTFAGRNLKTWTNYSGFDPEQNAAGQSNFNTYDYFGLPQPRTFTARVDVRF
jgi:TonB-linked SusC/RagA family outer membrane protein